MAKPSERDAAGGEGALCAKSMCSHKISEFVLTKNHVKHDFYKVFEDSQETFYKKFLEWGLGQRPNAQSMKGECNYDCSL